MEEFGVELQGAPDQRDIAHAGVAIQESQWLLDLEENLGELHLGVALPRVVVDVLESPQGFSALGTLEVRRQ